jgi:predicted nucleic acid-binding Zn ribbon protein
LKFVPVKFLAVNQMPNDKNSNDFAQEFYWKMRDAVTGRVSRDARRIAAAAKNEDSVPFGVGRDFVKAGDTIDGLLKDFRWEAQLAEADLFNRWAEVVGDTNAAASQPEALINGTLTVRCKSTAWATQLRLMQATILTKLHEAFPQVEIKALKLLGPEAPSWKKGPRTAPGRGPRDTYG